MLYRVHQTRILYHRRYSLISFDNQAELGKRRYILVKRRFVLREERELGQKLRVEVKKGARAAPCNGPQHTNGLTFLSLEGCTFDRSLRPAVELFDLQFENE